jgi:CheY-like chemotaxis protein
VHQAATVQEARDLLAHQAFDVFLADMDMGSERGIDLLREQVDTLRYSGTRIVAASAQESYRSQCEALGVDLFLEKPIEITPLVTLVARLMSTN